MLLAPAVRRGGCTSPGRVARLCCRGRGGRVAEGGGLLNRSPARGAVVLWAIRARPGHYGPPLPEWTGSAMAVRMAEFGGGFLNRRTAPKGCLACCRWSAPPLSNHGKGDNPTGSERDSPEVRTQDGAAQQSRPPQPHGCDHPICFPGSVKQPRS